MLKTAQNEWTLKALQIETALLAVQEIDLPPELSSLRDAAEEKVQALVKAWNGRKPAADTRKWKHEDAPNGTPKDEELADVANGLKDEQQEWTLHRATSDKNDVVETLIAEGAAWMTAGGEYYFGQYDEERQVLEVGRDDESGEPGTGLVLSLTGELVLEAEEE